MKKNIVAIVLFFYLFAYAPFAFSKVHLNEQEKARVQSIHEIVSEIEKKSVKQMINEIEKTAYPEVNLIIKEAMAHTYADIVKEENVQGQHKREWLYSMIALNMAYFQFGGDKDSSGGAKNVNKLIRYKLKTYLPANIFNRPGFHSNLG
jgi:hypothetical protein